MPVHSAEAKFISKKRMQMIIATQVTLMQSNIMSLLLGICSAIKGPALNIKVLNTGGILRYRPDMRNGDHASEEILWVKTISCTFMHQQCRKAVCSQKGYLACNTLSLPAWSAM